MISIEEYPPHIPCQSQLYVFRMQQLLLRLVSFGRERERQTPNCIYAFACVHKRRVAFQSQKSTCTLSLLHKIQNSVHPRNGLLPNHVHIYIYRRFTLSQNQDYYYHVPCLSLVVVLSSSEGLLGGNPSASR